MKKIGFIILCFLFMLTLTACNNNKKTQIKVPDNITLNEGLLSFDKVADADGYQIKLTKDGAEAKVISISQTNTPGYDLNTLNLSAGEYKVYVKTVASAKYSDSDYSSAYIFTVLSDEEIKEAKLNDIASSVVLYAANYEEFESGEEILPELKYLANYLFDHQDAFNFYNTSFEHAVAQKLKMLIDALYAVSSEDSIGITDLVEVLNFSLIGDKEAIEAVINLSLKLNGEDANFGLTVEEENFVSYLHVLRFISSYAYLFNNNFEFHLDVDEAPVKNQTEEFLAFLDNLDCLFGEKLSQDQLYFIITNLVLIDEFREMVKDDEFGIIQNLNDIGEIFGGLDLESLEGLETEAAIAKVIGTYLGYSSREIKALESSLKTFLNPDTSAMMMAFGMSAIENIYPKAVEAGLNENFLIKLVLCYSMVDEENSFAKNIYTVFGFDQFFGYERKKTREDLEAAWNENNDFDHFVAFLLSDSHDPASFITAYGLDGIIYAEDLDQIIPKIKADIGLDFAQLLNLIISSIDLDSMYEQIQSTDFSSLDPSSMLSQLGIDSTEALKQYYNLVSLIDVLKALVFKLNQDQETLREKLFNILDAIPSVLGAFDATLSDFEYLAEEADYQSYYNGLTELLAEFDYSQMLDSDEVINYIAE